MDTLGIAANYYQQFDADDTLDVPGEGYGGWRKSEIEIAPEHTAVVVMHAWDCGTPEDYPGWYRCVEYIPRANEIVKTVFPPLLSAVRASELKLFHVVGGGKYYKELPGHKGAVELAGPEPESPERTKSDTAMDELWTFRSEHVFVGKHNQPDVKRGFEHVDFYRDAVYAAAYAGGEIIRYDPHEKWDQWNGKNPRIIVKLHEKGYIRPIGTIQLGADGKLYSGWMAQYGKYGGAVAVTDPKTEKTDLIENPLGEQAIAGLAVGDGFIFAGTNLGGNGLPNKKGESPEFGVIDAATKKVIFEHTFEGTNGVRPLAYDSASKRVVISTGKLWFFDNVTKLLTEIDAPGVSSNCVGAPGDGKLYYGSNNTIVALDFRTGKSETIAEAPGKVTNVAVDSKGNIYCSCGIDVYAVRRQKGK